MKIAVWLDVPVPCFSPDSRQRKLLRSLLPGAELRFCRDKEQFLRALKDAEAAFVWKFKPEWVARAPKLLWIATPAAGREDVPRRLIPRRIRITHGAFHGPLIAQTVAGAVLMFNRGLRNPEPWGREKLECRDVIGTRALIYGYGRVGKAIAAKLRAFGIQTVGVRRTPSRTSVTPAAAKKLLKTCDHLILALPSDTGTDNLVDGAFLKRLPPHAVVYNIGRGNSVDEAALLAAVESGRLAGAYLDVFKQEPPPADSPLLHCPKIHTSPHSSAFGATYLDRAFAEFAQYYKKNFSK